MPRHTLSATMALSATLALVTFQAHALELQQTTNANVGALEANSSNANSGSFQSSSTNPPVSLGTVNKFDTANGVLTGVSASLSGVTVTANNVSAARTASLEWTFGANAPITSSLNGAGTLSGASTSFANLSAYAGTGTFAGGTAKYTVTADRNDGVSGSAKTTLGASSVTQTVTYTYLQHSNASFGSATDVNSLVLTAGTGFNVYALAGSQGAGNTVSMDSVSYSCVGGDCGAFTFSLASFSSMAAGTSLGGLTGFNTTTAGSYSANYLFTFTDHTGVGVGQQQNTLSLAINGTVAAVPEPESYAMMAAGLAAVGFMARRRKKSA